MSIILKGIDLPSENNSIIVEIFPSGECSTMEIEKGECYEFCLNGNTEAIQIPKGHGRLIDAKLLADTINKAIQDGTFTSKSIWEWIGDAPTILEARKDETRRTKSRNESQMERETLQDNLITERDKTPQIIKDT